MKVVNSNIVIGIDAGNYNTASANTCFTSGYSIAGKESQFDDLLEWKGDCFTLSPKRIAVRKDKTINEDFLILSLFAIAKELKYAKIESGRYNIILGVGLPPGDLSTGMLKSNLQPYYLGEHHFSYNGAPYTINITKVVVGPQAYAGLHAKIQTEEMRKYALLNPKFQHLTPYALVKSETSTIVLDLGGGTVDVMGLLHGKVNPDINFSLGIGMVHVYNEINEEIGLTSGEKIEEYLMNAVLSNSKHRVNPESVRIIRKHANKYAKRVIAELGERGVQLHSSYVICMGGGVSTVEDYFSNKIKFGKLDFISDLSVNAKGYEELVAFLLLSESRRSQ